MDESAVLEIATQAMTATAKLAAPVLLTSLFIGLFIGLIQSATQLNEPTRVRSEVRRLRPRPPVSGSWMMQEMISFTQNLFETIPQMMAS